MRVPASVILTVIVSMQAYAQDARWQPTGLAKELHPIAHLESSWGRNMNHEPHSKGPFFSSYGALGLKAITAYEAIMRSKRLQSKWSSNGTVDLTDKDVFFSLFTSNYEFYNDCASSHWAYLRRNTDSIEQAVFAWRWGLGASKKSQSHQSDSYVMAYLKRR